MKRIAGRVEDADGLEVDWERAEEESKGVYRKEMLRIAPAVAREVAGPRILATVRATAVSMLMTMFCSETSGQS